MISLSLSLSLSLYFYADERRPVEKGRVEVGDGSLDHLAVASELDDVPDVKLNRLHA